MATPAIPTLYQQRQEGYGGLTVSASKYKLRASPPFNLSPQVPPRLPQLTRSIRYFHRVLSGNQVLQEGALLRRSASHCYEDDQYYLVVGNRCDKTKAEGNVTWPQNQACNALRFCNYSP